MLAKRKYNTQPNIITNSVSDMSVIEKRIVYLAINQINTGINFPVESFKNLDFEIPLTSLNDTNYDRVSKAVLKLQLRRMLIENNRKTGQLESIIPFPIVKIANGVMRLTMLANVVPFFLELKKGFTKYELQAALSLNSVYSQKLYEHFSRWKDKKQWIVSLDELKKLLNAENYEYSQFRQKCLNIAIQEISEKTDLTPSYEVQKTGKSVSTIHFQIKIKAKEELQEAKEFYESDISELNSMKPNEVAVFVRQMLHNYSFSKKQCDSIMSNPSFFNTFVELDRKFASGLLSPLNPTAYIASFLFKTKK